jgi:hypothetical protein
MIRLRPWYKEPDAGRISAASKEELQAITDRASASWDAAHGRRPKDGLISPPLG